MAKDKAKKMESETNKVKRAEKNMKYFFRELKTLLERSEDEPVSPGATSTVSEAK